MGPSPERKTTKPDLDFHSRCEPKENSQPDEHNSSRGEHTMLRKHVSTRRRLRLEPLEDRLCLSSLPVGAPTTVPDAAT